METVQPTIIRYIKLGAGGRWEAALDHGRLEWGGSNDAKAGAMSSDWTAVADAYRSQNHPQSTVTGYTNEARAFRDTDPDALWITFARGRMWWAFAEPGVESGAEDAGTGGAFYRRTRGGWSDRDANGAILDMERLSTRLSQLSGYQRTICVLSSEQRQLCLRYINAAADPVQDAVTTSRTELKQNLLTLIQRLHWRDFEELVDLVLARTGWVRVSRLGGTAKDIDLVVEQPFTRERMVVQVKSKADQRTVKDYALRLAQHTAADRTLLICHSPIGSLHVPETGPGCRMELMTGDAIADLSIRAGLIDWISEHAR